MRGQNHADRDLLRGRYKGLADDDLVAYVDEAYSGGGFEGVE